MDAQFLPSSSQLSRFSPAVENILRNAGWFPGRVVSNEEMKDILLLHFYDAPLHFTVRMFSAAYRVMREFYGLTIPIKNDGEENALCFDPLYVSKRGIETYNWLANEWEVNSPLFPLGYFQTPHDAFVINLQGQVPTLEPDVYLIGNNIDVAIENMVLGRESEEYESAELAEETFKLFPYLRAANSLEQNTK